LQLRRLARAREYTVAAGHTMQCIQVWPCIGSGRFMLALVQLRKRLSRA
jgi:hypothetical protein